MRQVSSLVQAHTAHSSSCHHDRIIIRKHIMYVGVVVFARSRVFYKSEERPEVRWGKECLLGAGLGIRYFIFDGCPVGVWLLLFGQVVSGMILKLCECWRSWRSG